MSLGLPLANARGVTYLMLMFVIVIMGVTLTAVGKNWKIAVQREREADLLFVGNRIKTALQLYAADYQVRKATRPNVYPVRLEQLTEPPKRYLQKLYKDPITGQDFQLIKVGAEVKGVKSKSKEAPLDQVHFKNALAYDQIAFQVDAQPTVGCIPGPNPLNPLAPQIACPPPTAGTPAVPRQAATSTP